MHKSVAATDSSKDQEEIQIIYLFIYFLISIKPENMHSGIYFELFKIYFEPFTRFPTMTLQAPLCRACRAKTLNLSTYQLNVKRKQPKYPKNKTAGQQPDLLKTSTVGLRHLLNLVKVRNKKGKSLNKTTISLLNKVFSLSNHHLTQDSGL